MPSVREPAIKRDVAEITGSWVSEFVQAFDATGLFIPNRFRVNITPKRKAWSSGFVIHMGPLLAGLGVCVMVGFPAGARAENIDVTIAPFAWAPTMKGQLEEGPATIPLDAGPGDLAGGLRGGGMLHGEARGEHFQTSIQAIYVDFHDRNFAPVLGADVRSKLFTAEAMVGPRLTEGNVEVVPTAGFRYTDVSGELNASGIGKLTVGKRWTEGLAGLEARARVSDRIILRGRGTIAVTGPSGQSSSDLIVAGIYRLSKGLSLGIGYRWAKERLRSDAPGSFGMDLKARGPFAGLVIGL